MIRIILYNCGLQLLSSLPKTSLQHPSIVSDMKKRRKTSLYTSGSDSRCNQRKYRQT
jgi:hypothetical protein